MSSFATSWAWDQNVEQNHKLLLLFMADHADRGGNVKDLSNLMNDAEKVCGLDRQTIKKHLTFLENAKLVQLTDDDACRLNLGDSKPKLGAFRLNLDFMSKSE